VKWHLKRGSGTPQCRAMASERGLVAERGARAGAGRDVCAGAGGQGARHGRRRLHAEHPGLHLRQAGRGAAAPLPGAPAGAPRRRAAPRRRPRRRGGSLVTLRFAWRCGAHSGQSGRRNLLIFTAQRWTRWRWSAPVHPAPTSYACALCAPHALCAPCALAHRARPLTGPPATALSRQQGANLFRHLCQLDCAGRGLLSDRRRALLARRWCWGRSPA